MKSFAIILLFSFLMPDMAQAYIPRTQTIVKKMSRNNGRREYTITREVSIESKDKQIKTQEVWTVAHGDRMKLHVTNLDSANPWKFSILYSSKDRKTLSQNKSVKTFKKSPDFFEPLFHDRSHKSLLKRLVQYRFVPEWIKDNPPPSYTEGKTTMTPEPFISLMPMEGTVNYAIGANSNNQGGNGQTRLWIEQDSFLITKGRLRSQAEFTNSNFRSYAGGLRLPSEQVIHWKDRTARVKVIKVERTKTKKKDWTLKTAQQQSLPSAPLVKEFYSRFR